MKCWRSRGPLDRTMRARVANLRRQAGSARPSGRRARLLAARQEVAPRRSPSCPTGGPPIGHDGKSTPGRRADTEAGGRLRHLPGSMAAIPVPPGLPECPRAPLARGRLRAGRSAAGGVEPRAMVRHGSRERHGAEGDGDGPPVRPG